MATIKTENSISVGVTRMFKLSNAKTVKAFANIDIFVNDVYINSIDGVKVIDNGGENGAWVGMPSTSYVDKKKKTQYNDVVVLSQSVEYAVKDAVLAAFENESQVVKSQRPVRKAKLALVPEGGSSSSLSSDEDIPF